MTPNVERPPPGVGAAPELCHATLADNARIAPNADHPQAEILRLVRPLRRRRLDVQIVASDGRVAIGRTRPIRLTEPDLAWLLEAAQKIEVPR